MAKKIGQAEVFSALILALIGILGILVFNIQNITGRFVGVKLEKEKTDFIDVYASSEILINNFENIISGRLILDNGTALSNREIKVFLNDVLVSTLNTNEEGNFEISLNLSEGKNLVKVVFEGDEDSFIFGSEKEIEIYKEETFRKELKLFTDKDFYEYGEKIKIYGELIYGEKISDSLIISINLEDKVVYSIQVEAKDGKFETILDANFSESGNYKIKAVYKDLVEEKSIYFEYVKLTLNVFYDRLNTTTIRVFGNLTYGNYLIPGNVTLLVKNFQSKTVFSSSQNFSDNFEFYVNLLLPLNYSLDLIVVSEYGVVNKTIELKGREFLFKPKIVKEKFNYNLGEKAKFEINFEKRVDRKNVKVYLIDPEGSEKEVEFYEKDGKYFVDLDFGRSFRPGLYKLKVKTIEEKFVEKGRAPFKVSEKVVEVLEEEETEFGVGLVAVNTPKSIYLPGEEVKIIVGILNYEGRKVSNAFVNILVTSPSGKITTYSTLNGSVHNNGDGTYVAYHNDTNEIGNYTIQVFALNEEITLNETSFFEVRNFVEFDIEREIPTIAEIFENVKANIRVKPKVSVQNLTIVEKLPINFTKIKAENAQVIKKENEIWIIWNFEELNQEFNLTYSFDLPHVTPYLYLLGPLEISYDESKFIELKPWNLLAADVRYFFFTWSFRDTNNNPVSPMALCRGKSYFVNVTVMEVADDVSTSSQQVKMQVKLQGEAMFNDLPYGGLIATPQPYPNLDAFGLTENCVLDTSPTDDNDHCGRVNQRLDITNAAVLGEHTLKLYLVTSGDAPVKYGTNKHPIRIIECTDADLVDDIFVYSAPGEKEHYLQGNFIPNRIIQGHIGVVGVKIKNYNTSSLSNVNLSLTLLDGTNELNWFIIEGRTQTIPTLAPNEEKDIVWNFIVPDKIIAKTYTAKITIKTSNSEKTYYKNFDVYSTEGVPDYLLVFYEYPETATTDTTNDENHFYGYVCNYGDYNLTVNITQESVLENEGSTSTIVVPTPDENVTGRISWFNRLIPTSSCFNYYIAYIPIGDAGIEEFTITLTWKDPVTGETRIKSEKIGSIPEIGGALGTLNISLTPTVVYPGQTAVPFTLTLQNTQDDAGTKQVYTLELLIPPCFIPYGFSLQDPGYPIGSERTGWIVKWTPYYGGKVSSDGSRYGTPTGNHWRIAAGGSVSISFYVNVSSSCLPGGKNFIIQATGYTGPRAWIYQTASQVIVLNAPLLKTIRYYNTTPSNEQLDFPSFFACGNFSTKLQVFNKGNLPAYNFRINETKSDILKTHPEDLIFYDFNPSNPYLEQSKLISWDGGINFIATGKDNARNFTYSIFVPYQTNGTFSFQSLALNNTFSFFDEEYIISISCGASLSVDQIRTRIGEYPEPTIYVNDIFNISANIYNDGPGNASNVIVWINYTNSTPMRGLENLRIYNSSGMESNWIYLGNILPKETKVAFNDYYFTIDTTGLSPGIITFCINANATENSTVVSSCRDITINAPPALIELENPIAISKETGSSSGSWSFNFTFNISVRVSNSENDVQICSWFSKTGTEPFKLIGCDVYQAPGSNIGIWKNYSFEFDPDCSDIGNPVFVKFNATNFAGTANSTLLSFAITKSRIIFEEILGNSTESRRGKLPTVLSVRVKDFNGTYISNLPLRFYVTLDGIVYDIGSLVQTNSSGYANYNFLALCSPKYLVGYQKWKAELRNDECYFDNSTENYFDLRVLVTGDIIPNIVRPDGTSNYTQEDTITFLAYVIDDCGDPLTLNTTFFANHSLASFECSNVIQVGSNAYTCDWHTEITTPMGWYNVSMFAWKEFHYSNWSVNFGIPGLFYLLPIYKLENPQSYPLQEGWGYKNWNFTVLASSGDSEESFDVNIYLGNLWPPALPCYECVNFTPVSCFNCYRQVVTFLRNFSSNEVGTWYYRFSLGPTSTTEVKYVIVEKDDVSLEYVSGNNSVVIRNTQSALLSVRVFDLDANTYELNPPALVTFKIYDDRYPNGYKVLGSVYTNESGYANYLLNITDCYGWLEGSQYWGAEITDDNPYYKKASIGNYSITIQLPGCQPQIDIYSIELPRETFQYKNFTIVTYVTSWVGDANDAYINISIPNGWFVDKNVIYLGEVKTGEFKRVSWNIYPTSSGVYKISFYANSSNAGSKETFSREFIVYNFLQTEDNSLPKILQPEEALILKFDCEAGDYRVANLTLNISSQGSKIRIETFNSSNWITVKDNLHVEGNENYFIPILLNQISSNSDGKCLVRISNIGDNFVNIEKAILTAYYNKTAKVEGIKLIIKDVEVESLDKSEDYLNVSVRIGNSLDEGKMFNLTLKLVKDGNEIYSSEREGYVGANSYTYINFTNIQVSNLEEGEYRILAILSYENISKIIYRNFVLGELKLDVDYSKYQCNSTTEKIKVKIYQPLEDKIEYNVSLRVPNGWSYSPSFVQIYSKGKGYYEVEFNLTAFSDYEEEYSVFVVLNYSYAKGRNLEKEIKIRVSPNIPILEVIREIPSIVSSSIVFKPRIVVHNKGCGIANNVTLVEKISAGWIGANPSIEKNEYANDEEVMDKDVDLIYAETDLINNILTWKLSEIKPNKYAVLSYQVKAPPGLATEGTMSYNVSWNEIYYLEDKYNAKVYTYRYPQESHLQFDLFVTQDPNYPWPEVRSIRANEPYNLTLKVTNIGDINTNSEWTIKLYIPDECYLTNIENGYWNSSERKIVWQIG
ncbi:MAG: hypothetical protein QXI09_02895, partial [Candidatus Aenigmatarchaeota archaeon]